MISILVFVVLVALLLLIARRSSKNRDAILIEVILGIAGSVAAAVIVTSFPKVDTDNFLGYLDNQIYELVFGKKAEAPPVPVPNKKAVVIKKNVSRDDRKIEGVYAGLIRSVQNGGQVLGEKAYVLRVDPAKKDKVLEIYEGGDIEYKVRIDGTLENDGVTWVGETKSVLKGDSFVQDDLKLLLSPEVGRIDWHQHDKIQNIESIGILHKIDEATVSNRFSAVNRIKNDMVICKEEAAKLGGKASLFLFIPLENPQDANAFTLQRPAASDKIYTDIISGTIKPYEGPYDLHVKTRYKSNDFPNLTGMKRLHPDLSSFVGFFDKDYSIGVNRPGDEPSWFKESLAEPVPCRIFFVGFPPANGFVVRQQP
jgi:uncharacterized membrane protein YeaQ/YmgE (transglycosylase-associated protein family)